MNETFINVFLALFLAEGVLLVVFCFITNKKGKEHLRRLRIEDFQKWQKLSEEYGLAIGARMGMGGFKYFLSKQTELPDGAAKIFLETKKMFLRRIGVLGFFLPSIIFFLIYELIRFYSLSRTM